MIPAWLLQIWTLKELSFKLSKSIGSSPVLTLNRMKEKRHTSSSRNAMGVYRLSIWILSSAKFNSIVTNGTVWKYTVQDCICCTLYGTAQLNCSIARNCSKWTFNAVVSRCFSSVGKQSSGQVLSLGPGCDHKAIVEHELLHALGFYHMQSRQDRDDYVKIWLDQVIDGKLMNPAEKCWLNLKPGLNTLPPSLWNQLFV